MKFKTFITTLVLFLIMFYSSLLLISYFMLSSQLNMAKDRGISEHYLIISSFGKDLAAVSNRKSDLNNNMNDLYEFYVEYYKQQGVFLEIQKDDKILHTNFVEKKSINFESNQANSVRQATIQKINTNTYVCVVGEIPGIEKGYYLSYIYNISDNLEMWGKMQGIMLLIGVVCSIIIAVFLQISLNKIFKPLSFVSAMSKKIATGNYGEKIPVSGHDELAEMTESFNNMSDEIQIKIAELAEEVERKQQFVDNFSHEIRTPLTSVYGYAEFLQKADVNDEEQFNATSYIMSESRNMLNIADSMLELATLKNINFEKKIVKTDELFQSVKDTLGIKLKEKQIDLTWNCEIKELYGEPNLLKNLLVNLTDNSIKACEVNGKILLEAKIENANMVVTVNDNGKGMKQEELENITEPFYRIDKGRNRTEGGAGLGLAICKQIADCHNASLSFTSNLNAGTTAKITFAT